LEILNEADAERLRLWQLANEDMIDLGAAPKLPVSLIANSITPEGLIVEMRDLERQTPHKGRFIVHNSASCCAEELATFMGRDQNRKLFMMDLMTDWFDCKKGWYKQTKGMGKEIISAVWFNFIGCTTPEYMNSIIPAEAVDTGFMSRFMVVYASDKKDLVSWPGLTPEQEALQVDLVHDLKEILEKAVGPFEWTTEAREWWDAWYHGDTYKNKLRGDPRFTYYLERKQAHLMKLAMISSVARRDSGMVVTKDDFVWADTLLDIIEDGMPMAFANMGARKDMSMRVINNICQYIVDSPIPVPYSAIMDTFSMDISEKDLVRVLGELKSAGRIKTYHNSDAPDLVYWGRMDLLGKKPPTILEDEPISLLDQMDAMARATGN
jgi:hypothetical protein